MSTPPIWTTRFLELIRQRDQARSIACSLEAENAELIAHIEHLTAALDDEIGGVPC